MPLPLRDIRDIFTPSAVAEVDSGGVKISHKVERGTLQESPLQQRWIRKEMADPAVARIEILAQEFFRLIIPNQSETRLAVNKSTGTHHILSEEVPGYRKLPLHQADKFANGEYPGLGQVMLCAMFLQEIDLKNGNVGLDSNDHVIKIDGDWCFAKERFGGTYALSPMAIDSLPYPKDFTAFNWLDLRQENVASLDSKIVNPALSQSPLFRAEVNQALLKICLLPDEQIEQFVDAYMPAGGQRYVDIIKNRREELAMSALQNPSFVNYLSSASAATDATLLTERMETFVANNEHCFIPVAAQPRLKTNVTERMTCLILMRDNASLLAEIKTLHQDPHYVSYAGMMQNLSIESLQEKIQSAKDRIEPLQATHLILTQELDQIQTQELASLKNRLELLSLDQTCRQLLVDMNQFAVGGDDKLLSRYISTKTVELLLNNGNLQQLNDIKQDITNTLASISSPQVRAVKDTVQALRGSKWFNVIEKIYKAMLIEQALANTPLEDRGTVLSSAGPANPVQEQLAYNIPSIGKPGPVNKTNGQEIDLKAAAQVFKDLKEKFGDVVQASQVEPAEKKNSRP